MGKKSTTYVKFLPSLSSFQSISGLKLFYFFEKQTLVQRELISLERIIHMLIPYSFQTKYLKISVGIKHIILQSQTVMKLLQLIPDQ